ncbi:DNA polymerase [Streptomyces sp. DHE17-7]|uniref:DNA polymerase n=1 Tax=Streptomyces sp. DHE17-7 TaxID=2759949 RepID=UPI0022EB9DCD|nr:DNA polymerase [Streptomyces sp. DHE17-7]MBJ6623617.1 DNA polymerase [Streptomyces sp. DHE17-7]
MITYFHEVAGDTITVFIPETDADLREFMHWARTKPELALDTETTGLAMYSAGYRLRTVQFGTAHEAWVIHYELGGRFREAADYVLKSCPRFLIHNAPFDWLVLDAHTPVSMESLAPRTTDTKIKAILVDPRQPKEGGIGTALKPLSAYYIDPGAPDTQGDLTAVFNSLGFTKETGWAGIDLRHPTYNLYAGLDVIYTARLNAALDVEHTRLGVRPSLLSYEHEIAYMCACMQRAGLVVDLEYVDTLRRTLREEEEKYLHEAATWGVSSVNSGAQVSEALLAMGETLTEKTDGGGLKVDKEVLLPLADLDRDWNRIGARAPNPLAEAVLRAKRAGKWVSSYADKFANNHDANGRIHPTVNTLQARTGRMSISGDFAAQTLPSSDWMIRRAILGDGPTHIMGSVDFQAIEMRVLAALADVRRMKQGFSDPAPDPALYPNGFDIHLYTARLIKGDGATARDRKVFKGAGFGKVYGGGVKTIARQTGATEAEISRAVREYDRVFPEIRRASSKWQREAKSRGCVTVTPTGRILPLDRNRMYAVVNYKCQSTARDVLGQAMIHMRDAGLLEYMKLPIHDEIVFSAPKSDAKDIAREFEKCMTMDLFGVPITAEADLGGRSWGSLYGAAA